MCLNTRFIWVANCENPLKIPQLIILLSVSVEKMSDRVSENIADFQASYCCPYHCFCLIPTGEREKSVSVCQLQRSQLQDFDFMLFSFSKQPGGQHHRILELLSGDNFQILVKKRYLIRIFLPSFLSFSTCPPNLSFFLSWWGLNKKRPPQDIKF